MHKIEEEIILTMMIEMVITKVKEMIEMINTKTAINIVIVIMIIETIAMIAEKMSEAVVLETTTIKIIQEVIIVVIAEVAIITEDIEERLKCIIIHQDVRMYMFDIKKTNLKNSVSRSFFI
jgi:hypothetical protein